MTVFSRKIKGAFDVLLLFPRGIDCFEGDRRAALRSAVIPAFLLVPVLLFAAYYPPKGMEAGYSLQQVLLTNFIHYTGSFVLTTALAVAVTIALKKKERFWLFFEAGNWAALAFSIVVTPLALLAIMWPDLRDQMDRVFVIVGCYSYVVTACIAYRAFAINWQLAGAFSIMTLLVNQEMWNLLYWAQGIPDPW